MPRIPRLRRVIALLAVTLLLAACAGTTTGVGASGEPASEQPLGSASAEPTPQVCAPGVLCSGTLAPGDYTSTGTGASIAFTLAGTGWSGDQDTPGEGFALFNQAVGGANAITVTPWAGVIFSDPCSSDATKTIGSAPADFMTFLVAADGVKADAPVDVQVGGVTALRLDLTTHSSCADAGRMWLFNSSSGRGFNFRDAEKARMYAVDAGSVTVIIGIEALGDADYDLLIQKAEEILATMTIAPASKAEEIIGTMTTAPVS